MIDPPGVAAALQDYLRRRPGCDALEFQTAPTRLTGGFDTAIFRVGLRHAPPELSQPLVLRVLRPGLGRRARYEAALQEALAGLGYPAPRVALVETDEAVLGGAFLLMQEIAGQPLAKGFEQAVGGSGTGRVLGFLLDAPGTVSRICAIWAQAHVDLHGLPLDRIRDGVGAAGVELRDFDWCLDELERDIGHIDLAALRPILCWLRDRRPAESSRVLCHGDFHPLNVMATDAGLSGVIDWANAVVADPAFDVGSTIASLTCVPVGGPALLRPVLRMLIGMVLKRYLAAYRRARPVDMAAVRYFQVYRCAAQMAGAALQRGGAFHSDLGRRNLARMMGAISGIEVAA